MGGAVAGCWAVGLLACWPVINKLVHRIPVMPMKSVKIGQRAEDTVSLMPLLDHAISRIVVFIRVKQHPGGVVSTSL